MADTWYCTWCGESANPDPVTLLDERFTTGRCEGVRRLLVRERSAALRLAETTGKLRPKPCKMRTGRRTP
jgi:hypothetical protein